MDNGLNSTLPLKSKSEDKLGRGTFIDSVTAFITNQCTKVNPENKKEYRNIDHPLIIGIYGRWGSGKTSTIYSIEEELNKKFLTAFFNPWMYNSEEELIKYLLESIIKAVKSPTSRKKLATQIAKYILNIIGGIKFDVRFGTPQANIGVGYDASKLTTQILDDIKKKETIYDLKKKIDDILKHLSNPIIIFIDDIDRLSKHEVYTLFKTVRLIADFKNIIYVLSFDDEMVAKSIKDNFASGADDNDGYNYLDKIVDIPLRLPDPAKIKLEMYFRKLLNLTTDSNSSEFDKQLHIVSHQLLETPRDCIRIANSVLFIVSNLGNQIDYYDLVLIESIRLKRPKLFRLIIAYYEVLQQINPEFYHRGWNFPKLFGDVFGLNIDINNTNPIIADPVLNTWYRFFVRLFKVDIIMNLALSRIKLSDQGVEYVERSRNDSTFNQDLIEIADDSNRFYNPQTIIKYFQFINSSKVEA